MKHEYKFELQNTITGGFITITIRATSEAAALEIIPLAGPTFVLKSVKKES
jgi:hypothetical protein